MYFYTAYGLLIESELHLPELTPVSVERAAVRVCFGERAHPHSEDGDALHFVRVEQDAVTVFWPGVGEFVVRNGAEIVVTPAPGVDEEILRLPLLGAVLAILLHQRGYMVLHASAVEIGGKAVAFLGPKGRGKSSMAATLYTRGHRLIADDIVAVDVDHGVAMVLPAFPQLKLWRGVAEVVLADGDQNLSPLYAGIDKGFCLVGERFAAGAVALHHIYILEDAMPAAADCVQVTPLEHQRTLVELIRYSYLGGLSADFIEQRQAEHFGQCAALAERIVGFGLHRAPNLASLLPAALAIEENVLSPLYAEASPAM